MHAQERQTPAVSHVLFMSDKLHADGSWVGLNDTAVRQVCRPVPEHRRDPGHKVLLMSSTYALVPSDARVTGWGNVPPPLHL